jgi:hypothetical protein
MTTGTRAVGSGERADLLESLAKQRGFLRYTVRGLTDEEATRRTTVSELYLSGLIKHVAEVEANWSAFIENGPTAMASSSANWDDPEVAEAWRNRFRLAPGQTLADVLERYDRVAEHTDELVATLPDLDLSHPLPEAPWFPRGARWSARRVILHIIAETSQHAGHADIIREALDGSKTMG